MDSLRRSFRALMLFGVLAGCGGGSGSNPGAGAPGGSTTSVSADATTIEIDTVPTDSQPRREVMLTFTDVSEPTLYLAASYSTNAVAGVDHAAAGLGQERIFIQFKAPSTLPDGVYRDTVDLRICTTEDCNRQVRGSPIRITATFTVESPATVRSEQAAVELGAGLIDPAVPTANPRFSVTGMPADSGVHFSATSSTNGIARYSITTGFGIDTGVYLEFRGPAELGVGTYADAITLRACYDSSCAREVSGSPITLDVTYRVTLEEPGFAALPFASRVALPHDVLDADYSAALDVIVMTSAWPRSALYVYDMSTGQEHEVPLVAVPDSVAVSPNGLRAAVGHDSLISIVDLVADVLPGAAAPRTWPISIDVYDIVLDDRYVAHAVSRDNRATQIVSVDTDTGSETSGTASTFPESPAKLHPSGSFVYSSLNGISPDKLYKFDITGGAANFLYEWPYHGQHSVCGNFWFDAAGTTIYGRCGTTFRSSLAQSQDMTYAGSLELTPSDGYAFLIDSLSQSAATGEIVLLESGDASQCMAVGGDPLRCRSHLGLHDPTTLLRTAVYALAPIDVAGSFHPQRGLFVFHAANGVQKYLLSRISGVPDPAAEYYLTILQ